MAPEPQGFSQTPLLPQGDPGDRTGQSNPLLQPQATWSSLAGATPSEQPNFTESSPSSAPSPPEDSGSIVLSSNRSVTVGAGDTLWEMAQRELGAGTAGAAIGSVVPGVGTVAGGIVGDVAGSSVGSALSKALKTFLVRQHP